MGSTMAIARRTFLAGGVAAAAVHAARAQSLDTDVVVIGAGAAGFGAARELQKAGLRFRIIEGRDRVGGRVYADRTLGDPFDAGAYFIHWAEKNPWREVAQELGVVTGPEDPRTAWFVYRNAKLMSDEERMQRRMLSAEHQARMRVAEEANDDQSFAQVLDLGAPGTRHASAGSSYLALGEEPEHASVIDYGQLWSGDDLVMKDCYGTLVERALAPYPVSLSTPARGVRWNGNGVTVETAKGDIRAAAVIVTVSVGVLQSEAIRFTPALPRAMLNALDGFRMGALTKVALKFDGARLGLEPGTDLVDVHDKPNNLIALEAWAFERNNIVTAFGGDFARGLIAEGEPAAVDHILSRVVAILGAEARKHFLRGRLAGWAGDPFARGSYAIVKPGRLSARDRIARPVGERIWLAGEASAGPAAMTAGGATLSGERAAREAIAIIRKKL